MNGKPERFISTKLYTRKIYRYYIERVKDTHRQRIITYNHNQLKDIYMYIYILYVNKVR